MNRELIQPFTKDEILASLNQMALLKFPGSNGFNAGFFKHYRNIVGAKVTAIALKFLNEGQLSRDINHTFIALIPKTKHSQKASDYRSISLCNVVYKLISKVLANRLKPPLPSLISTSQSAFIQDRLITVSVIIAYEVLHSMRVRQKSKEGSMAIKLDIFKAFDLVEWAFLKRIMKKLGFDDDGFLISCTVYLLFLTQS